MSKQRLTDTLAARSPLAARETVQPVNLYPGGPDTAPTATPVDSPTNGQVGIPTSSEDHKSTNGQAHKTTNSGIVKYTTHLRPTTVKAVKRAALDADCKDYEIVQRALDDYLNRSSAHN